VADARTWRIARVSGGLHCTLIASALAACADVDFGSDGAGGAPTSGSPSAESATTTSGTGPSTTGPGGSGACANKRCGDDGQGGLCNGRPMLPSWTVTLNDRPLAMLADPATHTDVPMIVGSNRDENKIFMALDPRLVRTVAGTPVGLRDPEAYDRLARYRSALWKADGVDDLASVLSRHGAPVFAYRWVWDVQGRAYGVVDLSRILGASHGLEIPFVFGHFDVGPQSGILFHERNEKERLALSARMMRFWAEFARTGDPGKGLPGKGLDDPSVAHQVRA
jgi:para-nitrobenzyl esterase